MFLILLHQAMVAHLREDSKIQFLLVLFMSSEEKPELDLLGGHSDCASLH
jgi:hypothetical protein